MRNVLKEPFSQILNMHKLLSGDSVQQFAKLGTWPRKYRRMCFEIEEIHSQSLIYSKSQDSQVFCKWAANWVVNPDLNEQKTKLLFCQSLTQLRPTLYDPMDSSMPGFPVLHHLPELAQIHVHWISDAIQPSHPLSSLLLLPSIFLNIMVFSNEVGSSHQVTKVLEVQLQHQSFQWIFRKNQ